MLKITIVLFSILAASAINASRTPEELENYRQGLELKSIDDTKSFVIEQFENATSECNKLETDAKVKALTEVPKVSGQLMNVARYAHREINARLANYPNKTECMTNATSIDDAKNKALRSVIRCVEEKWKIPYSTYCLNTTATKDKVLRDVEDLRKKLSPCINDNKSDAGKAEKCLFEIEKAAVPLRLTTEVSFRFTIATVRNTYMNIDAAWQLCNTEHGVPNYSKISRTILDEIAYCFQSGETGRHIREVPPVWVQPNDQPLPNSTSIPIQRHKNLQEMHDKDDLLAVE